MLLFVNMVKGQAKIGNRIYIIYYKLTLKKGLAVVLVYFQTICNGFYLIYLRHLDIRNRIFEKIFHL